MVGSYERFVESVYETAGDAITGMAASLEEKDGEIAGLMEINGNLARELAAYKDGLAGDAGDDSQMNGAEYRLEAAAYEAAKKGGGAIPPPPPPPAGGNRRAARRGTGGRPGRALQTARCALYSSCATRAAGPT